MFTSRRPLSLQTAVHARPALVGLKQFDQAEQAFSTAKKLYPVFEQNYDEELFKVRYFALQDIGFEEPLCQETAQKHATIQVSLYSPLLYYDQSLIHCFRNVSKPFCKTASAKSTSRAPNKPHKPIQFHNTSPLLAYRPSALIDQQLESTI